MALGQDHRLTREAPDHVAVGGVASAQLERAELAEIVAWREAKLTATTAIFFGVPLLIATAQIITSYLLTTYVPEQAKKASWELDVLHIGAATVTTIGVASALLIVLTSFLRVWRNFVATWKELGSSASKPAGRSP